MYVLNFTLFWKFMRMIALVTKIIFQGINSDQVLLTSEKFAQAI